MFIPENYDKTVTNKYMKFAEGVNKVRFMSEPITGYIYWVDKNGEVVEKNRMAGEGGKPVRAPNFDEFSTEARNAMKPFAAAVVWNYDLERLQVLEVKQVAVMKGLEALAQSKSWGDITSYDVLIIKTKTGAEVRDVEYGVMPEPKADVPKEALEAYNSVSINLDALFSGEDPFTSESINVDEVSVDDEE